MLRATAAIRRLARQGHVCATIPVLRSASSAAQLAHRPRAADALAVAAVRSAVASPVRTPSRWCSAYADGSSSASRKVAEDAAAPAEAAVHADAHAHAGKQFAYGGADHASTAEASPASKAAHAAQVAATRVGDYVHRAELAAMHAMTIEDLARFRGYMLVGAIATVAALYLAYPWLKRTFITQTSDVASELLAAEELQAKTSLFASAVLHQTLTDPAIFAQTQVFLRALLLSPDTLTMVQDLVTQVLRSKSTYAEVRTITDALVRWLLADPGMREQLTVLLIWLLQQPSTQAAAVDLVNRVLADPALNEHGLKSLVALLQDTLNDPALHERARQWLWTLLADESLRKQGGDYLFSAYKYSITPTFLMSAKKRKAAAGDTPPDAAEVQQAIEEIAATEVQLQQSQSAEPRAQEPTRTTTDAVGSDARSTRAVAADAILPLDTSGHTPTSVVAVASDNDHASAPAVPSAADVLEGLASLAEQHDVPATDAGSDTGGNPSRSAHEVHVDILVPTPPQKLGAAAIRAGGNVDATIRAAHARAAAALPSHSPTSVAPRSEPVLARYADILAQHEKDELRAATRPADAFFTPRPGDDHRHAGDG